MKVKKILVSQPKPVAGDSPFCLLEEKYSVKVIFRPFIKTEMVSEKEFRAQKVNIPDYTAICFTSTKCIEYFFQMAKDIRVNISDEMKYFCSSETIANYLQKFINFRKRKVFFGATGTIQDMMAVVTKHSSEKYLVVRPESNNEEIISEFDKSGVDYKLAIMCRTVSNDFGPDEPFDYDMLLFFSPHGVEALKRNFPDWVQGERVIGCTGKLTAQAIKDAGLRLDIEAPSEKFPSLPQAVFDFIKENHKRK
ncbi:MAG: uroporphyrinogen-III synthase [bacterium]|nr:uroporphyrinogen-III synthase [Candidatus Minthenecus merdequi]